MCRWLAYSGSPVLLDFNVLNVGNTELAPAAVLVVIIDQDTGATVDSREFTPSLLPGVPFSSQISIVLPELKNYVALLRGGTPGSEATLASATIRVIEPGDDLPAITDLAARAKSGKVGLTWSPVAGAASYNIYRQVGAAAPEPIATQHATSNGAYLDYAVQNGVTYTYTVHAVSTAGVQAPVSNSATATPAGRSRRR